MGNTYFISDLHVGHANVLGFDNRPFANIADHDSEIGKRWNAKVLPEDDVYILGDISWMDANRTEKYFRNLNGRKHLILGNHDHKIIKNKKISELFVEVADYKEISFDYGVTIVLSHYPIPCFRNHFYGWLHFYGHVHNSFEWEMIEDFRKKMETEKYKPCHMFNVGCMMPYMNYTPMSWEEIITGYNDMKLGKIKYENSRIN